MGVSAVRDRLLDRVAARWTPFGGHGLLSAKPVDRRALVSSTAEFVDSVWRRWTSGADWIIDHLHAIGGERPAQTESSESVAPAADRRDRGAVDVAAARDANDRGEPRRPRVSLISAAVVNSPRLSRRPTRADWCGGPEGGFSVKIEAIESPFAEEGGNETLPILPAEFDTPIESAKRVRRRRDWSSRGF